MKILFVWPGLTGYMGDCWRALAKRAQVKVLVDGTGLGKNFTEDVMSGIDWTRVTEDNAIGEIQAFAPDAIIVVGWHRKLPRKVAFAKELQSVAKFLVMDMPWRWSVRCLAARFVLRRYLRRFRGILVHGEPSARYARWLGFAPGQIHRHCICGVDVWKFGSLEVWKFGSLDVWKFGSLDVWKFGGLGVSKFGSLDETSKPLNLKTSKPPTLQTSKPQNLQTSNFLFVGRKVREKGIETLRKAYEIYRRDGGKWTLTMPEWIDPKDVPRMMREHACLVLPSLWEPWGVVVAEAKAAGMKIIVSDKVGARFDIPCDEVVPAGDAQALAAAMKRVEDWKFGGLEDWKFGGLEDWKFGGLEDWKFGGLEDWKFGGLEDWKFGCEAWAERVVESLKV